MKSERKILSRNAPPVLLPLSPSSAKHFPSGKASDTASFTLLLLIASSMSARARSIALRFSSPSEKLRASLPSAQAADAMFTPQRSVSGCRRKGCRRMRIAFERVFAYSLSVFRRFSEQGDFAQKFGEDGFEPLFFRSCALFRCLALFNKFSFSRRDVRLF